MLYFLQMTKLSHDLSFQSGSVLLDLILFSWCSGLTCFYPFTASMSRTEYVSLEQQMVGWGWLLYEPGGNIHPTHWHCGVSLCVMALCAVDPAAVSGKREICSTCSLHPLLNSFQVQVVQLLSCETSVTWNRPASSALLAFSGDARKTC